MVGIWSAKHWICWRYIMYNWKVLFYSDICDLYSDYVSHIFWLLVSISTSSQLVASFTGSVVSPWCQCTTIRSNYLYSIQIPNYSSHPAVVSPWCQCSWLPLQPPSVYLYITESLLWCNQNKKLNMTRQKNAFGNSTFSMFPFVTWPKKVFVKCSPEDT